MFADPFDSLGGGGGGGGGGLASPYGSGFGSIQGAPSIPPGTAGWNSMTEAEKAAVKSSTLRAIARDVAKAGIGTAQLSFEAFRNDQPIISSLVNDYLAPYAYEAVDRAIPNPEAPASSSLYALESIEAGRQAGEAIGMIAPIFAGPAASAAKGAAKRAARALSSPYPFKAGAVGVFPSSDLYVKKARELGLTNPEVISAWRNRVPLEDLAKYTRKAAPANSLETLAYTEDPIVSPAAPAAPAAPAPAPTAAPQTRPELPPPLKLRPPKPAEPAPAPKPAEPAPAPKPAEPAPAPKPAEPAPEPAAPAPEPAAPAPEPPSGSPEIGVRETVDEYSEVYRKAKAQTFYGGKGGRDNFLAGVEGAQPSEYPPSANFWMGKKTASEIITTHDALMQDLEGLAKKPFNTLVNELEAAKKALNAAKQSGKTGEALAPLEAKVSSAKKAIDKLSTDASDILKAYKESMTRLNDYVVHGRANIPAGPGWKKFLIGVGRAINSTTGLYFGYGTATDATLGKLVGFGGRISSSVVNNTLGAFTSPLGRAITYDLGVAAGAVPVIGGVGYLIASRMATKAKVQTGGVQGSTNVVFGDIDVPGTPAHTAANAESSGFGHPSSRPPRPQAQQPAQQPAQQQPAQQQQQQQPAQQPAQQAPARRRSRFDRTRPNPTPTPTSNQGL